MNPPNTEIVTPTSANTAPPAPPVDQDPPADAAALREQLATERSERQKAEHTAKTRADELERIRLEGLKQKEDWQKVAQDYEKKYTDEKSARENLGKAIAADRKMTAVREAAMRAGILESALDDLDLVDFPQVTVETTSTGRTNVLGVDSAIQWLKTKKTHWFRQGAPNINGNSPGVGAPGGTKVSETDILKAEDEARKTGDWSKVRDLMARFRNQK